MTPLVNTDAFNSSDVTPTAYSSSSPSVTSYSAVAGPSRVERSASRTLLVGAEDEFEAKEEEGSRLSDEGLIPVVIGVDGLEASLPQRLANTSVMMLKQSSV